MEHKSHNGFFFYCPLCCAPRLTQYHPRAGRAVHFFQVGLVSAAFTLALWNIFGLKGLVSFIPLWTIFEFGYRNKVREKLVCGKCGFDPVLYLVDAEDARMAVDSHWRRRYEERGLKYPKDLYRERLDKGSTSGVNAEDVR